MAALYNVSLYEDIPLQSARVVKRPSATCKTPYVADVILSESPTQEIIMAHSAALGCGGLCDKEAIVWLKKMEDEKTTNKKPRVCGYKILCTQLVENETTIMIGTDPKMAELFVHKSILYNHIPMLQNVKLLEREKKFLNSRFDFSGIDENNRNFILEVKNVPLANYENTSIKSQFDVLCTKPSVFDKIGYFPDGYRKKKSEPVSPRALKHIQELETICKTTKTRCILCFVIQRVDVMVFEPSVGDIHYLHALKQAKVNGVEIIAMQVSWYMSGTGKFNRMIPVRFPMSNE